MSIVARVKSLGLGVLGLTLLVGMVAIGIGLLMGAAAFSVWVLKWTFPAYSIIFLVSIVVFAPLALIPPTRGFSAVGLLIASYAFGAILWIWSMAYTYSVWGLVAVIVGLGFLGVGVVPIAMFAALVRADWGNLGAFVVAAVLTLSYRGAANWLHEKALERDARLRWSEVTAQAYEIRE